MESVTENQVPMEDKLAARFAELEEKIKNMPQEEQDRVRDAYTYAKEHHDGQLRKDGSPYITHPLEVAHLVADLGLDADSIIAALLHDTIEDTDATHEEVAKRFGVTVANLVEGVTKLNKVKYTSTEEKQMENLRKMLMAMAQDVRVILIKICDRVHNIRTLEYQSEKKQREKALETLEIYAPIAHRLGMQRMKWEMEDESLRFLDPVAYKEISDELAAQAKAHAAFMERIQNEIQDRLKKEGIKGTVYGRVKHVYSIYRKMYAQNKKLSEIFDLYAFRVIVDDIPTCYSVLGCIHDMYKAVLGRFKDYIGTPKPNMYQSLHTTGPEQQAAGHRGDLCLGAPSAGKPAGHRGGGIHPLAEGRSLRRRSLCLYPRRRCHQSARRGDPHRLCLCHPLRRGQLHDGGEGQRAHRRL